MRTLFLPSLALAALSAPLAMPQSAAEQMRGLSFAATADQALRSVRGSTQPSMLVFAVPGQTNVAMFDGARKLLQEEGLADLGIRPLNLLQRDAVESLRKHFGLAENTGWAIVDSSDQCLASGQALPAASELSEALASKGVKSPVSILRDFLKTRPDHLEARLELLKLQRRDADRRTKDALGLGKDYPQGQASAMPIPQVGSPGGTFAMSVRVQDGQEGPGALSPFGPRQKPAPMPKGKVLETAEDLLIWGGFAESFDRLMTGDDWIAAGLEFDMFDAATEACSPLVKGLFRRKIAQVEAALERVPSSQRLWSVWIRMAEAIGGRSAISLADRLALPPDEDMNSLPRFVREKLLEEARDTGNWPYVVENLWDQYEKECANPRPATTFSAQLDGQSSEGDSRLRAMIAQVMENEWTRSWDSFYGPLLEALLYMDDIGRADAVVGTMRERLSKGQWSVNQIQKAIGLANRCNKAEAAKRWSGLIADYTGQ